MSWTQQPWALKLKMLQPIDLKNRLRLATTPAGATSSDFDLNVALAPSAVPLREAAVLIAFLPANGSVDLVLTKRSSALKHHPGQIAFPGGKFDETDGELEQTALREAEEEIALPQGSVEILTTLPAHETVTGFQVTPFVAWIEDQVTFKPETGEVSEVFRVPAEHVLNINNFRVEGRFWRGQLRKYYTVPYGPYYIWGATARMLRSLAEAMSK